VAEIKFVARMASQGEALIIWIPKDKHTEAKKMKGKEVKVIINDEI